MFLSNHGPISYRLRDRRRFPSKIAKIFPPHCTLRPRWRGSPWNWARRWGQKTRMMGLPGGERSLSISSIVWIQCTSVTDRQTDRQTPGDSKERAYAIRTASRGKNMQYGKITWKRFWI